MAWLLILILLCPAVSGLLSFALLRFPRSVMLPSRGAARPVLSHPHSAPLQVTAPDGVALRGYSVAPPGARGTILLVHGWGANLETLDEDAELFLAWGFGVAGCDLRGHGESGGRHTMLGFHEVDDQRLILEHLRRAGRLRQPLVLYGVSLGGTLALCAAAEEPEAAAVFADSPFNRLDRAADHYAKLALPLMPKYPLRWLTLRMVEWQVGHRLSALSAEAALPSFAPRPLLLFHCEGDGLVLCRNSDEIAAAYAGHVSYWRVPGGEHLSARWDHPDEWERRVREFLERVVAGANEP